MPSDRYPAIIRSVDRNAREVRVEVPPFTDGADVLPLAEIEYPIGDDSKDTEIRLVEGLPIWVAFVAGDPRYPIITGYRNPNTGNEVGWRRWNHDNIEWNADAVVNINAGTTVNINAETINLNATKAINLVAGNSSIKITLAQIAQIAAIIKLNG
ncbi:hypothetical protein [Pseudomonas sp. PNPG3]|uniref:hypothetical protein n=1 Tax=Pseudomonas sp. PNPG3 TaxID=2919497 RepID=UPI001FFD7F34|nr:hypothetical protein [Pseudomonas sp. PNPG3]MCK2122111.1 hypothetical protein [Pseudomonas sp. PNPG3]